MNDDRLKGWKMAASRSGWARNLALVACSAALVGGGAADASAQILDQLAVSEGARSFAHLGPDHALTPGVKLPVPQGVFPRYVDEPKA